MNGGLTMSQRVAFVTGAGSGIGREISQVNLLQNLLK